MHRCDTVPEELVGRGFKSPSRTRVQLTIYAGQLGLAMTGFSIGYIRVILPANRPLNSL